MIFFSYSRKDKVFIESVSHAIDFRTGLKIWKDSKIRPGSLFNSSIQEALNKSKVVVVFWSKNSINSAFVIDEATRANADEKLIPIRIDESTPPLGFGGIQTIDFFLEPELPYSGNSGLDELIFELTRRIEECTDIMSWTMSVNETEEYELLRRIASGLKIFSVFANRENLVFIPLSRFLSIIGFKLLGGIAPEEMSGREVCPLLDELKKSDVILIAILPSMLTQPSYMKLIFDQRDKKPIFVLLLGSLNRSDVVKKYPFLSNIEQDHFIHRRNMDLRLEDDGARDAWELVRKFVSSVEFKEQAISNK